MASARLVALRKKGKSKPRPVAMGLTFRRLGARWLMRTGLPQDLVDYLHRGQQFGTAAKGINEKMGHAWILAFEQNKEEKDILIHDMKNGFNSVFREAIARGLAKLRNEEEIDCKWLNRYFARYYGSRTPHFYKWGRHDQEIVYYRIKITIG